MADQPPPAPPVLSLWHESVALRDQTLLQYQARRRKAFRILAVMLGVVVVILLMLLWLSPIPYPYFAPIFITDYQSRQVPLLLDTDFDRDAFRDANYFPRKSGRAFQGPDRIQLVQELGDLAKRSVAETVVVYLSALSRTGPRGEVYVFPSDADPTSPDSWLPLTDVLQQLKACRAHSKLLILDIMAPMAGLRSGVLADDVAAGVVAAAEDPALADPHRMILCACSPGQVSLTAPEIGRTVFSYYVEEGLRGWADGYGSKGKLDRRVSARELADFVRARVDRWAWRDRLARQTPLLIAPSSSFNIDLRWLKGGIAQPHLGAPEEITYPNWLADGWKMRQAWWAEEVHRTMPHLFRELESVLLEGEKEWAYRVESARAPENRALQIRGLAARKQLFRFPAEPEAYSLPLAQRQGQKADPEVMTLVRAALGKPAAAGSPKNEKKEEKAAPAEKEDKTGKAASAEKKEEGKKEEAKKEEAKKEDQPPLSPADALERLKARPHYDVAQTVFDIVAADPEPTPEKLRQFAAILRQQEPRTRYVETLFLERLAELAPTTADPNWNKEAVRRAIDVVRMGERAASMSDVFDWIRGPLAEAAEKRHQGETLLFARGYVPIEDADQVLRRAAADYEVCLSLGDTIQRAQRTVDEALAFLPADVGYVERTPRFERDWTAAVRQTDELYRALRAPIDANGNALPSEEVLARAEAIRAKTDDLQARLTELRRPFVPEAWAGLKDVMSRPDTGPFHLQEIESLLCTPFIGADDRAALWKAYLGLARRLHDQTREVDIAEDGRKQSVTPPRFGPEGDPRRAEQERAIRRARLSLELLRLGGIDADTLTNLENLLEPGGWFALDASLRSMLRLAGVSGESLQKLREDLRKASGKSEDQLRQENWFALGLLLHRWWADRVPTMLERNENLSTEVIPTLDRMSRVFSPVEIGLATTDSASTPQIQIRQERTRALWTWLADWNRYLARDALNLGLAPNGVPALYAAAAESYAQAARTPVPEVSVYLTGGTGPFSPGSTPYPLRVRLIAPKADPGATLRLFTRDDHWFSVVPQASVKEPEAGSLELPLDLTPQTSIPVPLQILLKPGTSRPMPPPRGVLVRVMSNGRAYHHLVPVSLQSVTDRLEILLSTDNQQPSLPVGELRLRPITKPQEYHLYVRNPSAKPRNVIVQLRVNGETVKGGETKLTLPPDKASRIAFPPPTTPAPAAPAAGAAAPAKPPAAPAGPPELAELTGPLQVRLLDGDNRDLVLEEKWFPAGVASPREYVQVTNIGFTPASANGGKNRLSLTLALDRDPGCTAELVLPADRIPGLLEVKGGNRSGEIAKAGDRLTLYAEDLVLDDGADEDGYAYLNVDRCARAFVFRTTFARRGEPTTPREEIQPAVRLRAPTFVKTGDPLPVVIEVDNAPTGATLELGIGTMQAGVFTPESTRELPTARHTRIGFNPGGEGGAMLFDAMIRDWQIDLDTRRIKGERVLLARLREPGGQVVRTDTLRVVIDDQAAEKVTVILPQKARKDAPLVVEAVGQVPVSGVKEVNFFFGKPMDNKPPAGAVPIPGTSADPTGARWTAKIPLDGSKRGPVDISAEFKSNVGLSSFGTATVELTDADQPEPGKVEGTVTEGPRAQAGLTVILLNEKKEEKGRATTDESGFYRMENIPPGKYKVSVTKPASRRKGEAPVQVEPGKTAKVDVSLHV